MDFAVYNDNVISLYKKDVILFPKIKISNLNHNEYPRGMDIFKTAEIHVLDNIKDKENLNLNWDHKNYRQILKPKYKNFGNKNKLKNTNKNCIIITTINKPTKQILFYSNLFNWDLIIVGDSKTDDLLYKEVDCIYLGLNEQKNMFPTMYDKIPLQSYTRKMFGYLYALKNKYEVIYDTDDDNQYFDDINSFENNFETLDGIDIPGNDITYVQLYNYDTEKINYHLDINNANSFTFDKRNNYLYLKHSLHNKTNHDSTISGIRRPIKISTSNGFVNIYKIYTDAFIWPRGIPPGHKSINEEPIIRDNDSSMKCAIIQGLVNNDPDVDAHYRININNNPFNFEKKPNYDVILDKYSVCPFNTQNTFWFDRTLFYAMYLPVSVTFRYTDILRGLIALYQLWKNNKTIKFTYPTAIQERNAHDLYKDYESELSMYQTVEIVVELLNENKNATIEDIYAILATKNIIDNQELDVLNEWIKLFHEYY